jgi:hypothetical protein
MIRSKEYGCSLGFNTENLTKNLMRMKRSKFRAEEKIFEIFT